jgi:hypothetical protein
MRRVVRLATVVVAVLLACRGVVPAQTAAPASSQADSPKKTPKKDIGQLHRRAQGRRGCRAGSTEEGAETRPRDQTRLRECPEGVFCGDPRGPGRGGTQQSRGRIRRARQCSEGVRSDPSLGIDKIGADLSSTKAGDGSDSVSNVNAYIIDTGIYHTHPDLNVVSHSNFTGDGKNRD